MRLLLIEDERQLADPLAQILHDNHYTIDVVYNGEDGLDYGLSGIYDGILLDIMLPKIDGLTILQYLRKNNIETPILLLTALGTTKDKITGLDFGADDYLTKPFSTEELLARVRAMGRRQGKILTQGDEIVLEDLFLNSKNLLLLSKEKKISLSLTESHLLEVLMRNYPNVVEKEYILEKVWGYDSNAEHNHVEIYISFLRKKLLFLNAIWKIKTVRGIGYQMEKKDV